MHTIGRETILKKHTEGSPAMKIMTDPSGFAGMTEPVGPTWNKLFKHIETLKLKMATLAQNAADGYKLLESTGRHVGEPSVIITKMFGELTGSLEQLNNLSMTHANIVGDWRGDARNSEEADSINYCSLEATEIFHNFLTSNSISMMRLQEYYTASQLELERLRSESINNPTKD